MQNNIECAIEHKCAKKIDNSNKCAQCEIGYSFIACEPIMLRCKHHVCRECVENAEKGGFKCKFCSAEMKSSEKHDPKCEAVIQLFFEDLGQNLKDKYKEALRLFRSTRDEPFEIVSSEKQKEKDQIDLQVEELKNELEKMREDFHKEVDKIGDDALEYLEDSDDASFKEQFKEPL